MLRFDAAASTTAGPRPENQDSALVGSGLIALADGVGGHVGGSIASSLVISWLAPLQHAVPAPRPGAAAGLRKLVAGANARISAAVREWPWLRTMATTLVVVLAGEAGVTVAHIGDSRLYLLRDGRLARLTVDQTFVQELLDGGYITAAEAAVHPQRSVIYAALQGGPADVDRLQVTTLDVGPGDRLLLCSDGLSDVVSDEGIERLLGGSAHPADRAHRLVAAGLDARASDNVTVVVADVIEQRCSPAVAPFSVGAAAQPAAEVLQALEALWPGLRIPAPPDGPPAPATSSPGR